MANESPLRPIVARWMDKLRKAWDYKKRVFADDARECMKFFNGPYDWLYGPMNKQNMGLIVNYQDMPQPTFRMTTNKVAEMVQLFGPKLYQQNPHRTITPRLMSVVPPPPQFQANPQMQMVWQQMTQMAQIKDQNNAVRAHLLGDYLNYTPYELGLLYHVRSAIDEAIIKGVGCLWSQVYTQPTGMKLVGSFADSCDNLLLDPDAETLEDCWWIAQRCLHAVWDVEREYGLKPGTLKPNNETWDSQADYDPDDHRRWLRSQGGTNDLMSYWKIYSKMGVGGRLKDAPPSYREILDSYGDNSFIVIADGVDYPLNVPPDVIDSADDQEIQRRLNWPVPFWMNRSWPVSLIQFHPVPRQIWPMSHLKPGMGELKFLNWAYSFLATKMPTTCRDFIAVMKSASEALKTAITNGRDLTVLELNANHGKISDLVQWLQHPPFNKDILEVIKMVADQFDQRVGLNALMYGNQAKQMRSASEAELLKNSSDTRPDDMMARVENTMTQVAQKEAMVAQMFLQPQDLAPVIGQLGAMAWQMSLQGLQPGEIVGSLDFRLEADTTRIPNRDKLVEDSKQMMQTLFGPMMQYGQHSGNYQPVNQLIADLCGSLDMDASKYQFPPPPPPPPPHPEPPKIQVSLKGEDIIALGLQTPILQDFGVPVPPPMPPGMPPGAQPGPAALPPPPVR